MFYYFAQADSVALPAIATGGSSVLTLFARTSAIAVGLGCVSVALFESVSVSDPLEDFVSTLVLRSEA
eukprot:CAMPEP_0184031026 /NCGR_PEP_ID=MMETSP0955-20130417/1932_1 /TAXON_ID=627963 /ORGANISM="Aplanochytrium sp, Strain PBS07" /LENGTH=67 /DNA_ID=CAMNT_0026316643 /DNA_START=415 /DNA_END=618 /DNA_ORIENTATION=+